MKGFAVTLDSVVAISFFFFALVLIATQTYEPRAPGGTYLKQLTLDVLTVMEKTGRMNQAIEGNTTSMQDILEATPHLACFNISILNSTGETVITSAKSGCNDTEGLDMQVAYRPLVYKEGKYVAKCESWFTKETT